MILAQSGIAGLSVPMACFVAVGGQIICPPTPAKQGIGTSSLPLLVPLLDITFGEIR